MNDINKNDFYRHIGVYGICVNGNRLLVIEKLLGPYTGRYDLPGGRLEGNESLEQAITREIAEETGFTTVKLSSIGTCDFSVLWTRKDNTMERLHHIAMMYEVELNIEQPPGVIHRFEGQDSGRAIWLSLRDVTIKNSSPLVLQAVEWINSSTLPITCKPFDYST